MDSVLFVVSQSLFIVNRLFEKSVDGVLFMDSVLFVSEFVVCYRVH